MIRTTGLIALAALALAPAAQADGRGGKPRQVMAVFAHPDDELFMAPALAALAREGAQVTIYHATRSARRGRWERQPMPSATMLTASWPKTRRARTARPRS